MSPYTNDDIENEAETRAELIDPALREAGWKTAGDIKVKREYYITKGRLLGEGGRREKPLRADYILQYKNRNLGVIEAKAYTKSYRDGEAQAIDYATRLRIRFTYATNGKQIYEIDLETGKGQLIDTYPTPEQLWEKTYGHQQQTPENDWLDKFYSIPFNDKGGIWQPRYYQENAINQALKAIAQGKQRILLTLATGTGKTAISFQIVYKLLETQWTNGGHGKNPKILFLADRNTLADQAFNAYSDLDETSLKRITPDQIRKDGQVPKNGSVFFTIYQTFMSGEENTPYFGQYPKDFFDLVIVDECHRGGANNESKWRDILEYFHPAVQLGMTATPKRDENADTYKYFGEPVYIYSLKQAINDGYLTPFRVETYTTTGDTYKYHQDDEILEGEIDETRTYTFKDQNRIIEIEAYEQKKVEALMQRLNLGQKSLVFCATQDHAAAVRDLINDSPHNPSTNREFCCRVTAEDGDIGDNYLKAFKNNERNIPRILTTSQKLSTGIDAPEVRNIVILKDIKSEIEFKQIIGRGTRLYDKKDYFTIHDFAGVCKKFINEEWDGEPLPPQPKQHRNHQVREKENPYTKDQMIKVQLSEKRTLEFKAEVATEFYDPDGGKISAKEFIKRLYGDLPSFFNSEEDLRERWKTPKSRIKLLNELEAKGYTIPRLHDLNKLINGKDSDIFDFLIHIAYNKQPLMRSDRANLAKEKITNYNTQQQEFLNFVLEQYINEGVQELDPKKLPDLLKLKYRGEREGIEVLGGNIPFIRDMFSSFQSHLYSEA